MNKLLFIHDHNIEFVKGYIYIPNTFTLGEENPFLEVKRINLGSFSNKPKEKSLR